MAYPPLTKEQEKMLLSNSIERVINSSLSVLQHLEEMEILSENAHMVGLVEINRQDWQDLKWLVVRLWSEKAEEIRNKQALEQA